MALANPEASGAAAARERFATFHQRQPDRDVRLELDGQRPRPLGRALEILYDVPADVPSGRGGTLWRHKFGDTGHGDTGARPIVYRGQASRPPAETAYVARVQELVIELPSGKR